jgi:aminopeptidase N
MVNKDFFRRKQTLERSRILRFLGLLIYGEAGLFFDEKIISASRKQYITTLVAHEIAHQWFGNLVSPWWWGEL